MKQLAILPLREMVIFPHMFLPLYVGREKSITAIEAAIQNKEPIFLVTQRKANLINPKKEELCEIGTIGHIVQMIRLPDDTVKVLIEGKRRARLMNVLENHSYFFGEVEEIDENQSNEIELKALTRSVKESFETYVKLNRRIPTELLMSIANLENSSKLCDIISAHLPLRLDDKQALLAEVDLNKRLESLLAKIQIEMDVLNAERKIKRRVKKGGETDKDKDYFVNEQMNSLHKEMGEQDEFKLEMQELEKKIKSKKLPDSAKERIIKELKKLRLMSPMSAEAAVIRNYIDWILCLPWLELSPDKIDLGYSKDILEEDHFGLDDVKDRILEFLSVKKLNPDSRGKVLLLAGPPGVGKTSLGRSIAKALGKPFIRSSLGGVRDEAEIRGHRKTYVGAMPGKIIQSMKKASANNAVFLLDEVDKMSSDFKGDPSSAMLEVLDPEQNNKFVDHYLELDYDLSKVFFICTANNIHRIPRPLLDRMELITISGYTDKEKFEISSRYLIPKALTESGVGDIKFSESAISFLITHYTREAGVRGLEREINTVYSKVAKKIVMDENQRTEIKEITPKLIEEFLGPKKFHYRKIEHKDEIGKVNGLAWTEVGGDTLEIECSVVAGKGKILITGKLGDVMQESVQAALSYVRMRAGLLGLEDNHFEKIDIHVHVPEGAVPKDGPSAGIAMASCIVSALTKIPVRGDLAMTGEITLRGNVLPIGGLKEKLLAAKRAKFKKVLIPEDNRRDLLKIEKGIKQGITIVPVTHADDVLKQALLIAKPEEFMLKKAEQDIKNPSVIQH